MAGCFTRTIPVGAHLWPDADGFRHRRARLALSDLHSIRHRHLGTAGRRRHRTGPVRLRLRVHPAVDPKLLDYRRPPGFLQARHWPWRFTTLDVHSTKR